MLYDDGNMGNPEVTQPDIHEDVGRECAEIKASYERQLLLDALADEFSEDDYEARNFVLNAALSAYNEDEETWLQRKVLVTMPDGDSHEYLISVPAPLGESYLKTAKEKTPGLCKRVVNAYIDVLLRSFSQNQEPQDNRSV